MAIIGVILGTAIGFVPPIVVIDIARRRSARFSAAPQINPLSIPWFPNLIGTLIAVPIAAMLIAAIMTRAHPPRTLT